MLQVALIVGAVVFAIAALAAPRILRQHNAEPRIVRIVGITLGAAFLACYLTWNWSRHFVGKSDPVVILAMCWVMFRTVPRKYLAAPLMLYLTDTALGIVGQERLFHLPVPYHALGDYFIEVEIALVVAWAGCFIPFLLKYHHALFDDAK
jgi:drug/metabolite transporter (DMT)-like permease